MEHLNFIKVLEIKINFKIFPKMGLQSLRIISQMHRNWKLCLQRFFNEIKMKVLNHSKKFPMHIWLLSHFSRKFNLNMVLIRWSLLSRFLIHWIKILLQERKFFKVLQRKKRITSHQTIRKISLSINSVKELIS